jgi:putative tricarboxylic transport membrane protein
MPILMPVVTIIIFIGGYARSYSLADLVMLCVFGILGYLMKLANFDLASLAVGLFLGPMLEKGLVQGMIICNGSIITLFSRPLAGTFLWVAVAIIGWGIVRWGWGLLRSVRAAGAGA